MGQWHLQAIVICYSLSTFCSYTTVTHLSVNIPKPLNPSNESSNMLDDSRERGIGRSLNLVDLVLGVVSPRYSQLQLLYIYHRRRVHIRVPATTMCNSNISIIFIKRSIIDAQPINLLSIVFVIHICQPCITRVI